MVALSAFGVVVALVALAPSADTAPQGDSPTQARRMIELCWQEQGRKSITPETARVIAGTCEQLEEEFIKKYGRKP